MFNAADQIRVGHERSDTVEGNSYGEFKAEERRTIDADRRTELKADDHLNVSNNQHAKRGGNNRFRKLLGGEMRYEKFYIGNDVPVVSFGMRWKGRKIV